MFTLVLLAVLLSHVTLGQKDKNDVKSIYFQWIMAYKKYKQAQNIKNSLKLYSK
jgi:hypothetical protein